MNLKNWYDKSTSELFYPKQKNFSLYQENEKKFRIYQGQVLCSLYNNFFKDFKEHQLESHLLARAVHTRWSLDIYFYFYCNPVLDPVTLFFLSGSNGTKDKEYPIIHPGATRFVGAGIRSMKEGVQTLLPANIILPNGYTPRQATVRCRNQIYFDNPNFSVLVQDPESWVREKINPKFSFTDWLKYVEKSLKTYRWDLELPDGTLRSLNQYGSIIKNHYKVEDKILPVLKKMFDEAYDFIKPPVDEFLFEIYPEQYHDKIRNFNNPNNN
jgi:hypothetical protein